MSWQEQKEPEWLSGPKDWAAIEAKEEKDGKRFPAGLKNAIIWRREALAENWPHVQSESGRYHIERMLSILERIAKKLGIEV